MIDTGRILGDPSGFPRSKRFPVFAGDVAHVRFPIIARCLIDEHFQIFYSVTYLMSYVTAVLGPLAQQFHVREKFFAIFDFRNNCNIETKCYIKIQSYEYA